MRVSVLIAFLLTLTPVYAAEVTITGIERYHSSAKVYFAPVPGAKDYRIYDAAKPNDVKYAGLIHLTADPGCQGDREYDQRQGSSCFRRMATNADGSLVFPYKATEFSYPNGAQGGPTGYDGPSYVLDYNGLNDGLSHTLVVEAVDQLGPAPKQNLYFETDIKAYAPLFPSAGMVMLGSNKGPTDDGKVSTNGLGPYTNNPKVIASSKVTVQADKAYTPIIPGASQVFLHRFDDTEAFTLLPGNCQSYTNAHGDWGGVEYLLSAGTDMALRFIGRQIECGVVMPFISSAHWMEVCADRESTIYGSCSLTPERSFQLNGGILHISQLVDDTQSGGRWMNFAVSPANDPLTHWNHQDAALNKANQWLFWETFRDDAHLLIANGPGGDPKVHGDWVEPWGASKAQLYDPASLSPTGLGFDNKRRWDFFLSTTHAAFFIEGRLVAQGPIPADKAQWLSGPLKAYITDYIYHSESGQKQFLTNVVNNPLGDCNIPLYAQWFNDADIGTKAGAQVTAVIGGKRVPANGYGKNLCKTDTPAGFGFPRTNEWHRDDMAVSVIPATLTAANDFSGLAKYVQPPQIVKVGDVPPVVVPPVVLPPTVPAKIFAVPHTPAYPLTSKGTRSSTPATYVPSGTVCGTQLGNTGYYSVKDQLDVNRNRITKELYSACKER